MIDRFYDRPMVCFQLSARERGGICFNGRTIFNKKGAIPASEAPAPEKADEKADDKPKARTWADMVLLRRSADGSGCGIMPLGTAAVDRVTRRP